MKSIVPVLGGAVLLLLIALPMSSCRTVESGFVGVKRTFGNVHDEPLPPGLHFVMPFVDDVVPMETRLISYEVDASAASKDLQMVTTKISVQHSLNGSMAPEAFASIGDLGKFDVSVVSPAVMESLKAVTAQYTAEELITKREAVKNQVSDAIQRFITHTLQEKECEGAIHIANVAIKDFNFSAQFNQSIEAKVQAQQEALRAKNEKEKRITEAEASAKEEELKADAEAYGIEKISMQRAASIEREAKALAQNPLLLQLRAIEKWNGSVPHYTGGGQPIPFIDVQPNATPSK
jgi:regulator of protease activity HflC (stomatin/prohibitin superfamily)